MTRKICNLASEDCLALFGLMFFVFFFSERFLVPFEFEHP